MADNILTRIIRPSARGKLWRNFVLILIPLIFAGGMVAGNYYNKALSKFTDFRIPELPWHLGLDLVGGTHLVYQADVSQIDSADRTSAVEGVRDVIERRVNAFGVSEPVVQTNFSGGEYRVIVELAGIKDVNEAINMIGETPLLEFKELNTNIRELTPEEQTELNIYNEQAEKRAEEVLGKLVSGGDFTELAKEYNIDEALKASGGDLGYVAESENSNAVNAVKNLKVGEYTKDLVVSENSLSLYKLEDKREKTNPFNENEVEKEVKASHLLICYEGSEGCESALSKEDAYVKIKELKEEATPKNFTELVKENSTEPGAAQSGGELSWFSKGMMVAPFEDTVFPQEVGTISYVVETKFGYHLIYKEDERTIEEYKISVISINKKTAEDIIGPQSDWMNTELTGKNLARSVVSFNPNDNSPEVSLEFDDEGAKMFAAITERNIGKQVAIFLDGQPISVPTVNEKIPDGRAVISGNFNIPEAKILVQRLNAGALPVPINLINQQTVGASLGKISLTTSLKAGLIGLLIVGLYMILYYRLPGIFAVFSLLVYGIFVLAIFKNPLMPVTLTLSGMAGFILSIGMAVDANVLIFERLKEELRNGNPFNIALEEGFKRAWPSIRDGNVSTLITCFILIQFSTSIVKGFALTLGIGVIMSMFSAIVITKILITLFSSEKMGEKLWLYGVKREKNN